MTGRNLEPFAATIEWLLDAPTASDAWLDLLKTYLEALGQRSAQQPNTIIGHIKGFTKFSEGEFIQVSVVSSNRPATITAELPENLTVSSISLTLNFLVYGLSYQQASGIAQSAAHQIAAKANGKAVFTKISEPDQLGHRHQHEG